MDPTQGTCAFSGPPSSLNPDFAPFDPAECEPWEQLSLLSANSCYNIDTYTMGPPASAAMGCRATLPFGLVWLPGAFLGGSGLSFIALIVSRCLVPPSIVRAVAARRKGRQDGGGGGSIEKGLAFIMDSASSVPFLFLVLAPSAWTQYTCTTPKDLMSDPVYWSPVTTFPNWYSFPSLAQLHRTGYSDKQKMALWALYYIGPNVNAAQALLTVECACFFYFVLSRSCMTSPRLAPVSFAVSSACCLYWLYFLFTQSGMMVTLWNSPYDPAAAGANTFNQTASPPVWQDPEGPEQIVCGLQAVWLVTIVPVIHFASSIYFLHYSAPGVGTAYVCCRAPASRAVVKPVQSGDDE
jgi:hypothetical protein